MLRCLATGLAIAAFTARASAQAAITSPRNTLLFAPSVETTASAKQSTPRFLQSAHEAASVHPLRGAAAPFPRDCPMPVHRPDTSALERMRVARPSPSVSYSMPRVELKCFNPLDQPR